MTTEKNKPDIKLILFIVIIGCIGLILFCGYLAYAEVISAKKSCEDMKGKYTIKKLKHICDGQIFYKYSDGSWGFGNINNWSNMNLVTP